MCDLVELSCHVECYLGELNRKGKGEGDLNCEDDLRTRDELKNLDSHKNESPQN